MREIYIPREREKFVFFIIFWSIFYTHTHRESIWLVCSIHNSVFSHCIFVVFALWSTKKCLSQSSYNVWKSNNKIHQIRINQITTTNAKESCLCVYQTQTKKRKQTNKTHLNYPSSSSSSNIQPEEKNTGKNLLTTNPSTRTEPEKSFKQKFSKQNQITSS